ncbi:MULTISPECIES: FUSC family protein [unclassified Rathayibacter]|uniref:FUSC family protein n=1 Tax=unclassified Rathayibacter TaxID=2609250 RepID=UPI00188B4D5E|nr:MULTISPECIES: FUSC family protein [unclassified Rathayibacter]MBF4461712.1 FUSC family protein [Rathayibacter sp. VKM Ac-2879]MBF4503123.1 FUSC family protein [Rathayibacter sp. VKM Ac-2878]
MAAGSARRGRAAAERLRVLARATELHPGRGLARAASSLPAVVQIVLAAVLAYSVAHFGLGHPAPVLALTVTLSSLGIARDTRPKQVAETAVGMLVGITISEVLLLVWGSGVWQLAVVLAVVFTLGRALSPSPGFAVAAGTQAMLVMVLPAPDGGVFTRSVDGLIGGLAALLCTAIVPRPPLRTARAEAYRLVSALSRTVEELADALRRGDSSASSAALERIRGTQPVIDGWSAALDSARGVARISPFVRRHRGELDRQSAMLAALDLATRNVRIVARRTDFLVRDSVPRPALGGAIAALGPGIALLGRAVVDPSMLALARQDLVLLATTLDPQQLIPEARLAEKTLLVLLRPLVVDLLTATGVSPAEARAALPVLA